MNKQLEEQAHLLPSQRKEKLNYLLKYVGQEILAPEPTRSLS